MAAIDVSKVGELAAKFMDQVAEEYGDDATIDEAIIIAAISIPAGIDDELDGMSTSIRCTSKNPVIQAGLMAWGHATIMDAE